MATIYKFNRNDINKGNGMFSAVRSTIETAFYGNNVEKITSLKEAYKLKIHLAL